MTYEVVDRALADASPIGHARVDALDLGCAEDELLHEILAAAPPAQAQAQAPTRMAPPRQRRRARTGRRAAAGVLVAAAIAAALVLGGGGDVPGGGPARPAFAAEAIRVAAANPRLLVSLPGWKVTRADELRADNGEMTFSKGRESIDVHWRPAGQYDSYFEDRSDPGQRNTRTQIALLGKAATRFRYGGTTDFTTFLPANGETFAEIRGDLGSLERYMEVVRSLRRVDVITWLTALPASSVRPADRSDVVDGMLAGIPLPPGVDLGPLRTGSTVADRYQLGAQVSGFVACGWFDVWSRARAAGNAERAASALAAMKTSRRWPILLEMVKPGDYPEVLWSLVDEMEAGTLERKSYRSAIGCDHLPG